MESMTDKQMEVILNLVADKFAACKTMDEVKKAINDVREMAKKEKASEQLEMRQQGTADLLTPSYLLRITYHRNGNLTT